LKRASASAGPFVVSVPRDIAAGATCQVTYFFFFFFFAMVNPPSEDLIGSREKDCGPIIDGLIPFAPAEDLSSAFLPHRK